jgi:phosphotransferase system enzyme I (PtsI)
VTAPVSFQGIGASPGVAVGRAFVLDARKVRTPKVKLKPEEADTEVMRFKTAITLSDVQLEDLKVKLATGAENEHALILEAHRMMLHDPMFLVEVTRLIKEETINAEWAVRRVCRRLRHQFDNLEDEYFRERKSDIEFVADRIVRNLMGEVVDQELDVPVGSIVVAHDISPADAAMLVKTGKVGGFVTDLGGHTSHMAIVARALDIPLVGRVASVIEQVEPGDWVIADGDTADIHVRPTHEVREAYRHKLALRAQRQATFAAQRLQPAVTVDGQRVRLMMNAGLKSDLPHLAETGAEGIGLFRTELQFMISSEMPRTACTTASPMR